MATIIPNSASAGLFAGIDSAQKFHKQHEFNKNAAQDRAYEYTQLATQAQTEGERDALMEQRKQMLSPYSKTDFYGRQHGVITGAPSSVDPVYKAIEDKKVLRSKQRDLGYKSTGTSDYDHNVKRMNDLKSKYAPVKALQDFNVEGAEEIPDWLLRTMSQPDQDALKDIHGFHSLDRRATVARVPEQYVGSTRNPLSPYSEVDEKKIEQMLGHQENSSWWRKLFGGK